MNTRSVRYAFGVVLALVVAFASITLANPASPITITDIDSPDPVASGGTLTYAITMVNTAGSKVTNLVMTDQLNGVGGMGVPPQLQITSTRGSCTQSSNLVTCNVSSIEGGGSWTVTITGVVTAADGTALNNTASVTGTHSSQNFTSTTTATTTVSNSGSSPLPDLTISKTGPTQVVVASPMTYTLVVNNQGNANASNIKVVDTLPAGLTGISVSGTSLFTCGLAGQTVTCLGGIVNAGANATITINGTSPLTTGAITNTAVVDPDNTIAESNEANNTSALVNTQVVASVATGPLTINLTDDPAVIAGAGADPTTPGATLTYKILVTNSGSTRADNVTIVDGTQGLQASSVQASFVVTNGTVGVGGGCTVAAPQTSCLARTLNPGGTILVTVSGNVIATAGSTIIDTASVTGNVKNTGVSATDTELTTVKPGIDLTITQTDSPDPVCARSWPGSAPTPLVCRGGLTYTFVVGNSGIYPANGVAIRDPLLAGTFVDSYSAPAFSGGCSVDGSNVLTCTGGTLGPQSTTVVSFVLVAPSVTGVITNTVTVDPNNAIFESDETNNTATATTLVQTGIDLTVGVTDAIDPIATSGTETYTILVNNLGTQDASNIRLRDTLPSGTIFRDVVSDHGFTCSYSSGVVECLGGAIKGTASNNYPPLGGSAANPPDTATITLRIFAQSFAGTMHDEARVDPLNEIAEADETNNVATQDTVVGSFPTGSGAFNQLTIAMTQVSPSNPVARNARVTYSIVAGNTGTDPAVGVAVRDFLPAGSRFIQATGTNGFNCTQVNNIVDCVGGTIASAGTATITLVAFAPDTPATYTNQAIVDPDNTIPEGDEFDNQAAVSTIVQNGGNGAFNDLQIKKTGTANVVPKGTISYTLQVFNTGSDPALNVTVRDVLPTGETFISAIDAGVGPGAPFICAQNAGVVNCTGAAIMNGGVPAARSITITATAPNLVVPAPGLTNTAVVDPDNTIPEGDEFNNTSSTNTTVMPDINLTITKDGPTVATQSDVTDYTLVVTNNAVSGPGQVATGVVVTDPLPVGLIPLAVDSGTGNDWACQIDQDPINLVTCAGDLDAGSSTTGGNKVTIKITVFITAENNRPLDNVACVDPNNAIVESNELDNCSDHGSFVAPPPPLVPDLLISKQVDNLNTTPGANLTYTLTVSNVGTVKAKTPLTVTDVLPSEVTFVNTTTTNAWTCSASSGTPVTVTCNDGGSGLDVGDSAQITILATVNNDATIPVVNAATVAPGLADCPSGSTCTDEPSGQDNNSSQVISSIGSSGFDLAIATITDNPDPVAAGQGLKYTIVGVNAGTSDAHGVHVEVDLPTAGVTFLSAAGSNGFTCSGPTSSKLDCVGDLDAGANTTITVSFITLLSALPPSVTLTATIDPTNQFTETNEGNNTLSQTTTITTNGACTSCIDLVSAQLVASPEPVAGGSPITLTYQIVNVGDSPTTLNPTTDRLLELLAVTDGSVSGPTIASSNPAITCTVDAPITPSNFVDTSCKGNLAPGEGVTITLSLTSLTGSSLEAFGIADPDGLVTESNESNNTIIQSVVIF